MNAQPKWRVCPIDEDNRESESSRGPKRERKSLARFEARAWISLVGFLDKSDLVSLGLFLCQDSARLGFQACALRWFLAAYFGLNLAAAPLASHDDEQDRAGSEGRIAEAFLSAERPQDQQLLENLWCDIFEVEAKARLMFEQLPQRGGDKSLPQVVLAFFSGSLG